MAKASLSDLCICTLILFREIKSELDASELEKGSVVSLLERLATNLREHTNSPRYKHKSCREFEIVPRQKQKRSWNTQTHTTIHKNKTNNIKQCKKHPVTNTNRKYLVPSMHKHKTKEQPRYKH